MSITDNVTVMRKGITIKSLKTSKTNPKKLAELMVGRSINSPEIPLSMSLGGKKFKLQRFS